jgi:hypothetical protein
MAGARVVRHGCPWNLRPRRVRLPRRPAPDRSVRPGLVVGRVIAARDGPFPRWHMNASYALAILSLGTGVSVLIDTRPFAPGGVTLVLYALFVLWLGVTSWLLMRPLEPTAERGSPAFLAEVALDVGEQPLGHEVMVGRYARGRSRPPSRYSWGPLHPAVFTPVLGGAACAGRYGERRDRRAVAPGEGTGSVWRRCSLSPATGRGRATPWRRRSRSRCAEGRMSRGPAIRFQGASGSFEESGKYHSLGVDVSVEDLVVTVSQRRRGASARCSCRRSRVRPRAEPG